MRGGLRGDDRGVSTTLSHVLSIAIGTMLVTLLITGMTGFLEDETERATRAELQSLGARLADDVAAADHLTRHGGSVSVPAELPERIVDRYYTVELAHGDRCTTGTTGSETCLVLRADAPDVTVVQPLSNSSAVELRREDGELSFHVEGGAPGPSDPTFGALSVPATVGVGGIEGSSGGDVVVNKDPVAGFVFRPGDPLSGDEVTFVNDTEDLDGQIVSYEWTFELPEGGNRTVQGPRASHTYETPGVYTVTLEVTDDEGQTDTISRRVPVSGLVFTGDAGTYSADGDGDAGGVWFSLDNTWPSEVELLTLGLDPRADTSDVDGVDAEGVVPELLFDVGSDVPEDVSMGDLDDLALDDGYVNYWRGTTIPRDGIIADLDRAGDDRGDNPVVDSGDNVTVYVSELQDGWRDVDDASDHTYDVAVRYRVEDSIYVSKLGLFDLGDGDTVTWESAEDWDANTARANVTHPDDVVTLDAPAGSGTVPENGLQVWLPLNESGDPAEAVDYGGSTVYEFDVRGDPTTGVSGVDGGTAYELSGSEWLYDDNAEDYYLRNADELTVSMWVKADRTGTDYGLIDTVDDPWDGDDDELGLRYDASGYAGGGSNSFKSSIHVGHGFHSDSYSYEYESDVQSTDWQHVTMRWAAGERVELFVDGERLDYRASSGATHPDSRVRDDDWWGDESDVFMGIGRSQRDDTAALWEGKIDEVRIYDRRLDDDEVESLATTGGLRQGFLNTSWKETDSDLDLTDLRLGYDAARNGGTVKVTVLARHDDGSVVESDTLVLSGDSGVKEVEGLTGDADEFGLHVEFSGTANTPSADSFTLGD